MANVSSSTSSLTPKITRFKAPLLRSWSNSINFFISSLTGLISNLLSTLFRVRLLLTFYSSALIMSFILILSKVSSPCWGVWILSWLCFSITYNLISIVSILFSNSFIFIFYLFLDLVFKRCKFVF